LFQKYYRGSTDSESPCPTYVARGFSFDDEEIIIKNRSTSTTWLSFCKLVIGNNFGGVFPNVENGESATLVVMMKKFLMSKNFANQNPSVCL
jgi:hypothetical protein